MPNPRSESERLSFHEKIFGKGSLPPLERLGRGQTLNNILPMAPGEGPPLPRGLGIKWPRSRPKTETADIAVSTPLPPGYPGRVAWTPVGQYSVTATGETRVKRLS